MKDMFHYIYLFIIASLIVLCFYLGCNNPKSGAIVMETVTKIDTVYGEGSVRQISVPYQIIDTFRTVDTFEIHYPPITKTEIEYILNEAKIPTSMYRDSIKLDSFGYAIIKDTVQGLRTGLGYEYNIFRPTITNTIENPKNKKRTKVYIGLEYTYPINYLGASSLIQFKNDNQIKLSYGRIGSSDQYSIGYFTKIKLKK